MKNSKKIISLMLCLALVFSTFACLGSFTISAAGTEAAGKRDLGDTEGIWWYSDTKTTVPYSSGSGTSGDPYIVTTAAQLRLLARGGTDTAGKYYKLGNDIVINDTSYVDWYERSGLTNWIKGSDSTGVFTNTRNDYELSATLFRGILDGNGFTISGLYIDYEGTGKMNSRTAVGWALFPSVQGATIKNLKLKDVYIKSNVSQTCGGNPHGYAALVGYCYDQTVTVSNVQIENVKFDIKSPNQQYAAYFVGVGSIIGFVGGTINATDCIVKNISGNASNNYFNDTYKRGSAGSLIGFVAGEAGRKHTLKNIISIGRMNPISAGEADPAFTSNSVPFAMPIRSGSTATNVYAIGDVTIRDGSGVTKAVDEATFKSTYLNTFYNSIGGSTNWSDKNADEVPYLKLFPPVEDNKEKAATLICNFSNYTTKDAYSNSPNANTNWTIATDEENSNEYLQGDFTTVTSAQDFAFTITPNVALGNGSNLTGYYGWGESGAMQPGTVYNLTFKAKAEKDVSMSYAIYNGYSFGAGYNNRDEHIKDGVYDASGSRVANLTTEWQEYSMYFTAESYPNNNGQGTNRPIFQIQPNTTTYGNKICFDDIVMTSVNAVSFKEYDNHYSQPCVGEIGEKITLPATNPKREGYSFDGWYIDEACTVALDTENTKIGDITVAYAKWTEAADTVLSLNFTNYINGSSNTDTNWVVTSEGSNNILKGTIPANTKTSGFGFTLVDNSKTNYDWQVNGPLVPGKTYMITFRAKAKNNCAIDCAVYTGYSYAINSGEKHRYYDSNNYICYEETGNVAKLTDEWASYTTYFTADEYVYEGGTNRPVFYITNRDNEVWNNEFYFDDFEITPCDSYVSYNLYDGKYAKAFIAEDGTTIVSVNPERKNYIFEGWYTDANFTNAFTATTVSGELIAYAKWSEAVTELSIDSIAAGTADLGIKVTNANAYPIKFALETDGNVTVSIFTASATDSTVSQSVVWKRTLTNSGDIGALIEPAVISGCNELYISFEVANGVTASISDFTIGGEGVPTYCVYEGDVNGNGTFDICDLVRLKKMSAGISESFWTADIDGDDYIATAMDLIAMRKWLLMETKCFVQTVGDRTLVWNDEFDGNGVNYSNFSYSNLEGTNRFNTDSEENINVNGGKLNLSVSNLDGTTFKVPHRLTTQDKISFNRGYLEVRAKISATPGQWAGIWLSYENAANPFGEIDIMETNSDGTSFKPNIHSWDLDGNRLGQLGDTVDSYNYTNNDFNKTEYHIYGFEWDETELKFYVDGVCYETLNIKDVEGTEFPGETIFEKSYPFKGIFDQFYCVKFDNNIYDNISADGVMPEFNIDYVRLYQKDGEQLKINGELVEK